MVAYSFKARFAAPILAGTKRQTIRADRKRHARPGEELQLFTGMRTKHCKLIGRAQCLNVQDIVLYPDPEDGSVLVAAPPANRFYDTTGLLDRFAAADGFRSWVDMVAFWAAEHPGVDRFEGVLITWGDLLPKKTQSPSSEGKST